MSYQKALKRIEKAAKDKSKKLELSGLRLTSLPPEIGNLTNLKVLFLPHNQLTALPTELGKLTNLKVLSLSNNPLAALPHEIGKLTKLTGLDLSNNRLTALPPEIEKLTKLGILFLNRNQLTKLPPEIGKLTNLTDLYLGENKISALPSGLGTLIKLQSLDLSNNRLSALPPELLNLNNLRGLALSNNQLNALPPELLNLNNLEWLELSNNRLTALLPEIGNLTNLRELALANNQLTALPPELGNLKKLKKLGLAGNPIRVPPPYVVRQGTKSVLAYLRNILEKGEARRYEAKLLVLGDASEGKTCLSRALRGLDFQHQTTTLGVEIDPWTFRHPDHPDDDSKKITLNIWDFEGQEINHQSHQFFLTERSLYIVVFKGREQFRYDRVEYWLDTIRSRAPGVGVVLVATECESKLPHVPTDSLKSQYPDLFKTDPFYFPVGCANRKNIPELQEHLERLATDLELVGAIWPQNYADSEKAVKAASEKKAHGTRKELYGIFESSGVEERDFDRLASFLGDMGSITHFPDSQELREFIVLEPQWLTKAISHVLEHEELVKNYGECSGDWLRKEWEGKYPGLFLKFYHCMKEFELCYELEDMPGTNLVPLRFGFAKPHIPWSNIPGTRERRIQYRFNVTPPAGIMSRFIVKTHHLIARTEKMPKGVYWHNGVFLRTGEEGDPFTSEALCEFNKEERTLSIIVRAAYPPNMVEQLHGFANAVFDFFKGLKPERFYGCVREDDSQCNGLHDEGTIAYTLTTPNIKIPCAIGHHLVEPIFLVTGLSSFPQSLSLEENLRKIVREELKIKPEWAESFGYDIKALVLRSESLDKKIDDILKTQKQLPAYIKQQGQKNVREMLNGIDGLLDERDFTPIPLIFIITPVDRSRWNPKRFFERKFSFTPCCEYEKGIHKVEFQINFQCPRKWWVKTAPILSAIVKLLIISVKIGSAGAPMLIPSPQFKKIEDEINFMKDMVDVIPDLEGGSEGDILVETGEFIQKLRVSEETGVPVPISESVKTFLKAGGDIDRVARMELAALLQKLKPHNYEARQWGELERVKLPDNTYRWLCEKHREELRKQRGR